MVNGNLAEWTENKKWIVEEKGRAGATDWGQETWSQNFTKRRNKAELRTFSGKRFYVHPRSILSKRDT